MRIIILISNPITRKGKKCTNLVIESVVIIKISSNCLTISNKNIKLFVAYRMIGWINISTWIGSGNSSNVFIHISAVLEPDVLSGFFYFGPPFAEGR